MGVRLPNSLPYEHIEYIRGQYKTVLGQLRRENHDYTPYIGSFNPYTDRKIVDAEDFDEYLWQLAISTICKNLYGHLEKRNKAIMERQSEEISSLKKQLTVCNEELESSRKTRKGLYLIIAILAIALYISWHYFL